jgi:ubiquinone/menaquinone biosynthesis C-methylase UbiE
MMHEKRYDREIERLRNPERVARLEVDRVVPLVLAGLPDTKSVLDIGAGSGLFAEQFAARGLTVTGIDANPQMVEAARGFVPSGTFEQGEAESLPFADAAFDLAFMSLVLHETDDPLAALREAYRVTTHRLAVLEWPDEEQAFGPPRSDRLSTAQISVLADQAGFKSVQPFRLQNLILYYLEH